MEHEYQRKGALAYLAALDVHHAKVFGIAAICAGIVPFMALVGQVMAREPYASAKRVFWVAGLRLRSQRPTADGCPPLPPPGSRLRHLNVW